MSKTLSSLTNGTGDWTSGTTWATGSITPAANAILFAAVEQADATALGTVTVTGLSLTWVELSTAVDLNTATQRHHLFWAWGGATPGSGAVTANDTVTPDAGSIVVVELTGTNHSTVPVVQTVTDFDDAGADTAALATLAAFAETANGTLGVTFLRNNTDITVGTGFAETVEHQRSTNALTIQFEYKDSNDTTVDSTWTGGTDWAMFALEIDDAQIDHYQAIYTDGNGAGATIANIKAGTGTGFVTGNSTLNQGSGHEVTWNPTGLSGDTPYDLEYVLTDEDANDERAATVDFTTELFADLTIATLTSSGLSNFLDKSFPITISNLTVTGQTVDLNTDAPPSKISFTLTNRGDGSPYATQTAIEYAVFLTSQLGTLAAPFVQGNAETTDGSGLIEITTTYVGLALGTEVIVLIRKAQGAGGGADDDWAAGAETTVTL